MLTNHTSRPISAIPTLLIVQVGAFTLFHLSMALVFEIEWIRLVLRYDLLGTVNWLVQLAALYVPVLILAWLAFHCRHNKLLLTAVTIATAYSAYYWQYPMLTGFLFLLGQFDQFPEFLFANMPGIDRYPDI